MNKTIILLLLISIKTTGQNFVNGNFEINSLTTCSLNISNSSFNSVITGIKGIGLTPYLDVLLQSSCPQYGLAQNGNYYSSLENNPVDFSKTTALSFKLSDTLTIGNSYTFCFYDRKYSTPPTFPIEIGVSINDSTFGTLIYTSPIADTLWTKRTVSFNAPFTAYYITARFQVNNSQAGVFIDNFHKCTGVGINELYLGRDHFKVFPNPAHENFNIINSSNINISNIQLFNPSGTLLKENIQDETNVDLRNFPSGIYFLFITTLDNSCYRYKIIKD